MVSRGVRACWEGPQAGTVGDGVDQGDAAVSRVPLSEVTTPPACEEGSGLPSPRLRPVTGDVAGRFCLLSARRRETGAVHSRWFPLLRLWASSCLSASMHACLLL